MPQVVGHQGFFPVAVFSDKANQVGRSHRHVHLGLEQVLFGIHPEPKPPRHLLGRFKLYLHKPECSRKSSRLHAAPGVGVTVAFLGHHRKHHQGINGIGMGNLPKLLRETTAGIFRKFLFRQKIHGPVYPHIFQSPIADYVQLFDFGPQGTLFFGKAFQFAALESPVKNKREKDNEGKSKGKHRHRR